MQPLATLLLLLPRFAFMPRSLMLHSRLSLSLSFAFLSFFLYRIIGNFSEILSLEMAVPFFSGKSAFGIHEETRDGINSGGPSLEIYERPVLEHSKETARKLGMDFDLFFSSSPEFRRGKFLRSRERERDRLSRFVFSRRLKRERSLLFLEVF